ncbi:MAG: plastocyanin/azurin family copper-binding protein [Acidimicrobiales bacterium]
MRRLALAAVAVLGGVLLIAGVTRTHHSTTTTVPADAAVVQIQRMAFRPALVVVHAGQTVAWRFGDPGVLHNVTFDQGGLHSPNETHGTWAHRFPATGTFPYRCTLHPYMTGSIQVVP